uniref:HID1 domain-containing protein n=1 Tax=Pseudo-nitzschia australis TaxID=44445 RepID=A0A7S4EEW3_9STRA|mmetsp:Transcript_27080/g.59551  ORF Transcript_27080/g.59551 Transcript_27080/m.59551 type:complete len:802 (+) Transcript_27080:184-2589(+)|eukprot:CAMPEP_0168193598 /NCGR_PEP_ID=MMETSP0139_2-20121125/18695_1 /TAXON_ID=44445 /ORGANISM="Pseudo-nitzschia australis, Strain 10249 10 AB" /LENGTH=801 /DNA_ID=CAMNT_0008116971 /DNA_START=141 /DNA_END=2546 /DNA_ORIENTATION=-
MGASASREKFRESVSALIEVDVSADDADFWDELWKIPNSGEEVFELIPPSAARKLRDERFANLATLFTQATAQLCQIVETPYNIYFDQALNCVRVLTRILPFLLEKGDLGDADERVEQLCWGTNGDGLNDDEKIGLMIGTAKSSESGKTSRNIDGNHTSISRNTTNVTTDDEQEPLALLVVHAAMHMLFLPQFTCDFYENKIDTDKHHGFRRSETKEDKELRGAVPSLQNAKSVEAGVSLVPRPSSIVWASGSGIKAEQLNGGYDASSTRKYDKNRIEVLRLLLSTCCDPLFSPADEYNPIASRWLAVATAADAPNSVCLFYSLLNTVLTFDPANVGFSDSHIKLVELSAQVLAVLLDCGLPGNPEPVLDMKGEPVTEFETASRGGFNVFRSLMARIDSAADMDFIFDGFARLLKNVYEPQSSYLPNSSTKLECFQELLVLLWKFLEENPLFMNHVLTKCDINELVVPICFLMYKSRRDPAQIGLVHICTFCLLKLSGERSFGVALNKPFTKKLPTDLPLFSGGHHDLLTITLHKLVVNGAYKLVPLYSCFLTIICNVSPYWRSMSLVAAVKLVNLFELFSSPKFLYSGEHAHRHLALLLEVFNNVIQYQYHGNTHLVYALIRRKDSFGRLASLTLKKAQEQCHKAFGEQSRSEYDADLARRVERMDPKGLPNTGAMMGGDDMGGKFVPTEEWLTELKNSLPLETVTRLLQHLVPVVDEIVAKRQGAVDEQEILEVLRDIVMVGLLPVPHAIVIRKYQPNQYTALWFTAFMWGVIFLRNQSLPMFDGQCIELFQVSVQEED